MKKYFQTIKKCSLFFGVNDNDLENLLGCMEVSFKSYSKNSIIISEGDKTENLGVVLSGSIRIEQTDFYGVRTIIASLGESSVFAEAFFFGDVKEIPVSVVAEEKCEIMFVPCKRILNPCGNFCSFHKEIVSNLIKNLAQKNIVFMAKTEITSKRTTRGKLMAYLMHMAKKTGSASFAIPFDRQALADYLEVDRSGLSAEIGKLKKEKIIECTKNRFTLL